MKVTFRRKQSMVEGNKGILGMGKEDPYVLFSLTVTLALSSEEEAALQKYPDMRKHVFGEWEHVVSKDNTMMMPFGMADLQKGRTFDSKLVSKLEELEEKIRANCTAFKNILGRKAGFGGEETFEC